ncbi:MAG: HAD-IA family hydrolase, partial [Bacteroidaceae bacterium]|nr:HAD-IA family hydrolase [Bacteroidaceae bacterium]
YILSNGFIEVQHKKLQSAGIGHYFERMVLSDEIGINKPDRRLFDYALEVTHSQAADTLLIGDNYDADIMGAMQAGWGQIYFDRHHRGITAQEPQHTIHSLKEVMDIL